MSSASNTASVHLSYVNAGCNRIVGALDWGEGGLIAYCAHHAIFIYDPEANSIVATLLGHADTVTCLKWFTATDFGLLPAADTAPAAGPLALVSGSGDGTICIWLVETTTHQPDEQHHCTGKLQLLWTLAAKFTAHQASITCLTLHPDPSSLEAEAEDDKNKNNNKILLVSTGGDGDVAIWSAHASHPAQLATPDCWTLQQRLQYGIKLQHCCALAPLPTDPQSLLLALGGVDGHVRLLLRNGCHPDADFEPVCELAGHQNWIRGLAFTALDGGGGKQQQQKKKKKLLLASASQDRFIRVWAIAPEHQHHHHLGDTSDNSDNSTDDNGDGTAAKLMRFAPRPRFSSPSGVQLNAVLEALLIGHEDWVHSVAWKPHSNDSNDSDDSDDSEAAPCLLSASMDRTMVLWVPDKATGLWLSQESVGDAGTNHLGYYTGVWHPNGTAIIAHGYTGALHLWQRTEDGGLIPEPSVGGHCAPVVDACWGGDGGCLLSVSIDQTARMSTKLKVSGRWCEIARPQVHGHDFSCVAALPTTNTNTSSSLNKGENGGENGGGVTSGQSFSKTATRRCVYVSGSEEKVLRVFEAPGAFDETLAMARGQPLLPSSPSTATDGDGDDAVDGGIHGFFAPSTPAYGATLPALGLSNKAIYISEDTNGSGDGGILQAVTASKHLNDAPEPGLGGGEYNEAGPDVAPAALPAAMAGPPLEEHLAGSTLWPELYKLYGHGNEVYSLAAHPSGRLLASSCRAQSASTAGVMLWDTRTWQSCSTLEAHSLTVTQLSFSPNGKFLASVSRDRGLALFASSTSSSTSSDLGFSLCVHVMKAHARIVWGVAWSPDSQLIGSTSRDGTIKFWTVDDSGEISLHVAGNVMFGGGGVRSISFAPDELPLGSSSSSSCDIDSSRSVGEKRCFCAVGLDSGDVVVGVVSWCSGNSDSSSSSSSNGVEWKEVWRSSLAEKHGAAVRRLCWRRVDGEEVDDSGAVAVAGVRYELASCSDDHSVRIYEVSV